MSNSQIDEFSFDDFTVSTPKKSAKEKVSLQNKKTKIKSNEVEDSTYKTICEIPHFYWYSKEILLGLVEENKILEVSDGIEVEDGFYELSAKINLKLKEFKNLSCSDIKIKVPSKYNAAFDFSTLALCISSKNLKTLPRECNTSYKFCYAEPHVVYEDMHIVESSIQFSNDSNDIILIKKIPDGINLKDMLELYPENRIKIMTEILLFLHEVCSSSHFWKMDQNLSDNLFFLKKKWYLINTYYYYPKSYRDRSLNDNVKELAVLMGTKEEYEKIFETKFKGCEKNCIFLTEYKKSFCE